MERKFAFSFFKTYSFLSALLVGLSVESAWGQLSVVFLKTDATCAGRCDGLAIALGQGGAFPYTYQWSTGDSGAQIDSLCAGTYTVTVTDANMVTATGSVAVLEPNPLMVAVATEDQICGIAPDGSATAVPVGGTIPYTYLWSTGETTERIDGLAEGTYTVTVTDVNGCSAVGEGFVFFQNEGIWLMATPVHISCFGANDGQVYASPMTGTPPYTYDWGPGFPDTFIIKHLPPGEYTVTVTDVNGCSNTATAEVEEPPLLEAGAVFTSATCGAPGSVTLVISGGTPPYSVLWSNGDTTLTTLGPAGAINVTVVDANGCSLVLALEIPGNNTVVSVNVEKLAEVLCLLGGRAAALGTGGSGMYAFLWSRGDTTATVSELAAGVYTVTLTESPSGCTATASVTIGEQVSSLNVKASALSPAGCTVGGSATAMASGGVPPYIYIWNGTDTAQTTANLSAGLSVVVAIDSAGCTAADTVLIQKAPPLILETEILDPVTCVSGGKVQAVASGGIPPYGFLWSTTDTVAVLSGLQPGAYSVTAVDAGGCTAVASVQLVDPPLPSVTVVDIASPTCVQGGRVVVEGSGGLLPYLFAWSNGATEVIIDNLAPGTYTVVLTDANGCKDTLAVSLAAPPLPQVTVDVQTPVTCIGTGALRADAGSGTPPYLFVWSNGAVGATIGNLAAGVYTVTVTDAAGCTAQAERLLPAPPAVEAFIQQFSDAGCAGPGRATAAAAGGTPPFIFLWSHGATTATADGLAPGIYTVTATDALGCSDTAMVSIGSSGFGGVRLGDFVWFDDDQDGIQHPQEKGAPGIKVYLLSPGPDSLFFTSDDVVLDSTSTDTLGRYFFECVAAGRYVIRFNALPSGYQFSKKKAGTNPCRDSDANNNGYTDPFVVPVAQGDDLCIDAGIHVICVNVTKAGLICCPQTICEGETPALLFGNPLFPPQGGVGPLEYLWMQYVQLGPNKWLWLPIPGATDSVYQPGPLYATAYFMRCVRRAGCIHFLESNIITITVKPAGSPGCPPFFNAFTARRQPSGSVHLTWRTPPAVTRYRYVVERSADAQHWSAIGEVWGTERIDGPSEYEWMDYLPNYGMNYYRICRMGSLGVISFSEVRAIEVEADAYSSLLISPNPVSDVLFVRNTMPYDTDAHVEIFDAAGVLLYAADIPQGHMAYIPVSTAYWPAGLYFARIRWPGGQTRMVKVSKF